jgi:hypothetical protein
MFSQPFMLRTFLALGVFWLAAHVSVHGTPNDIGGVISSAQGETFAVAAPETTIGTAAATRQVPPCERANRLFVASHRPFARAGGSISPFTFERSPIYARESLTFTYDAAAPPGQSQNTVR